MHRLEVVGQCSRRPVAGRESSIEHDTTWHTPRVPCVTTMTSVEPLDRSDEASARNERFELPSFSLSQTNGHRINAEHRQAHRFGHMRCRPMAQVGQIQRGRGPGAGDSPAGAWR
jgi:hypothetical protein